MTHSPSGHSGLVLFAAFVGGAALGAVAAYLAQAQNRKAIEQFAETQLDRASRIPAGLRDAGSAVSDAFADALATPNRVHAGRS